MESPVNYADDRHELRKLCQCQSLSRKQNLLQMVQMKINTGGDHLQRGSLDSGDKRDEELLIDQQQKELCPLKQHGEERWSPIRIGAVWGGPPRGSYTHG